LHGSKNGAVRIGNLSFPLFTCVPGISQDLVIIMTPPHHLFYFLLEDRGKQFPQKTERLSPFFLTGILSKLCWGFRPPPQLWEPFFAAGIWRVWRPFDVSIIVDWLSPPIRRKLFPLWKTSDVSLLRSRYRSPCLPLFFVLSVLLGRSTAAAHCPPSNSLPGRRLQQRKRPPFVTSFLVPKIKR